MTNQDQLKIEQNILKPFPPTGDIDKTNPAIRLYGLRFYKDQTPVEYLAEFLLVFASLKGGTTRKNADHAFRLTIDIGNNQIIYWPEDRVALKLFAFLPSSKLETRHSVHRKAYLHALELIKSRVTGSSAEKDEAIRLLQSLFSGFVGVAKNRTWATYTFLPVSTALLARELDWLHSKAIKVSNLEDWDDASIYFATDRHNFMARGGELLFLQLAHLFSSEDNPNAHAVYSNNNYEHIAKSTLLYLKESIEQGLQALLQNSIGPIEKLVNFIESVLNAYRLHDEGKPATLGWVPTVTITEALLFANELNNICRSTLGSLEKIGLLQLLCCMQVLRSLCFQARRVDSLDQCTDGFLGNYVWIVANPTADSSSRVRKLAQDSFGRIEGLLYRVLRQIVKSLKLQPKNYNEADKHGFQIFRKIAKDIGLVIPPTGRGQRFVLPPHLIRFLVAVLVAPGERVRLTEFYRRVFAHYGIALGDQQLATALAWNGGKLSSKDYAVAADTAWVQEALQQGGFLVELSDAVSIVHNPVGREQAL